MNEKLLERLADLETTSATIKAKMVSHVTIDGLIVAKALIDADKAATTLANWDQKMEADLDEKEAT